MTELLVVTLLTFCTILALGLMGARAEFMQRRIESLLAVISAAIILFLIPPFDLLFLWLYTGCAAGSVQKKTGGD